MTGNGFTEDEVARRAGTTPERIARLAELGILEPEDGTYPRRDVLRARFVLGLDADRCRRERRCGWHRLGRSHARIRRVRGPPTTTFRPDLRRAERRDRHPVPHARTALCRVRTAAPGARRVRPRGRSAPPQAHPGALRGRGGRRRDPAAGAGVGGQRPTGRAVPEPLPPSFDRGAVPSTRPPRQRSVRGGAQGGQRSCGPLRRRPLGLAVQAPFGSVRDRAPLRSRRDRTRGRRSASQGTSAG